MFIISLISTPQSPTSVTLPGTTGRKEAWRCLTYTKGGRKKGRTRFELVIVFAIIVFKTTALNRSATGPESFASELTK